MRYLRGSEEKHAQELLVLYYLQRARFVEAVRLNDMLRVRGATCVDADNLAFFSAVFSFS